MYVLGIIFVVGITQHSPLERNAMNRKLDGYVMVECMYYIVKHIEYGLDPWIGAKSKVNEQKISQVATNHTAGCTHSIYSDQSLK